MSKEEKDKALQSAISHIEKMFGKGTISILGDNKHQSLEAISTGFPNVDEIMGIGGLPKGRIIELFGPESSGKSTFCLQFISSAQAQGCLCAYVDAEHAMDPVYATKLGVDIKKLLIAQPDSGEQALEIVDQLIRSNTLGVIIVDSVAALTPRAEIEGEMGQATIGLQARMMGQALRKLTSIAAKSETMVIFINQLRDNIGMTWGAAEVTPGGRALKFFSSVRLEIRRISTIKAGEKAIGARVKIKAAKNKVGSPFKQTEVDMYYGEGISKEGCVLDDAIENGIVEVKGAFMNYGEKSLGQGRKNILDTLKSDNVLLKEIINKVTEAKKIKK